MNILSEREFEERYSSVPVDRETGGFYWELEDIRFQNIPPERVWTARDGDAGIDTILTPGYGLVNRFAYVVTVHPWSGIDGIDCVLIRGVHDFTCPCDDDYLGEDPDRPCTCGED